VWLGFTDAKIGRDGQFIGLENYEYLWDDACLRGSVFNTLVLHLCGERSQVRAGPLAGVDP
jgi:ABC-type sugar transport system permease subunit